jgi:hypothetical protein
MMPDVMVNHFYLLAQRSASTAHLAVKQAFYCLNCDLSDCNDYYD